MDISNGFLVFIFGFQSEQAFGDGGIACCAIPALYSRSAAAGALARGIVPTAARSFGPFLFLRSPSSLPLFLGDLQHHCLRNG